MVTRTGEREIDAVSGRLGMFEKGLKRLQFLWIVTELYIIIRFCFTLLLHEKQIPILNEQANLNSGCPPR